MKIYISISQLGCAFYPYTEENLDRGKVRDAGLVRRKITRILNHPFEGHKMSCI